MSETSTASLPKWFWIIAGAAVLWNLMGVAAYLGDVMMSEEALAQMPQEQRALAESTPAWVTGVFAVAVFAGLGGAILLLIRKKLAVTVFSVSLAAVVVQMGYVLFVQNAISVLGAGAAAMPVAIVVIAALLVWFSRSSSAKGWLQ